MHSQFEVLEASHLQLENAQWLGSKNFQNRGEKNCANVRQTIIF